MTDRKVTFPTKIACQLVGEILQQAVIWGWYCIHCIHPGRLTWNIQISNHPYFYVYFLGCFPMGHEGTSTSSEKKAVLIGTCFTELRKRLIDQAWKGTIFDRFLQYLKPSSIRLQLGGGFKYFLFSTLFGEDSHFD